MLNHSDNDRGEARVFVKEIKLIQSTNRQNSMLFVNDPSKDRTVKLSMQFALEIVVLTDMSSTFP